MQGGRHNVRVERITIGSGNAIVGMYVSELDRPWLETPFVFQGFEIKDLEELALLQQYCNRITVDLYRGSLTQAQVRTLLTTHAKSAGAAQKPKPPARELGKLQRWARNFLLRHSITGRKRRESTLEADGYTITSTVRGEARPAFNAYARLYRAYDREVAAARKRGKISRRALDKELKPVIDSILRNPDAMAWTVFARRNVANGTSRAVGTAIWCVMFGRQLAFGRPELLELALGGLLLDIGYVRLPPGLAEHEGPMNATQRTQMAEHVGHGADILRRSGGFGSNIIDMVRDHHERADGSGYPRALAGSAIPPYARIAGIADAFDAMTSVNAYSPAYAAFDVARGLNDMRGTQFDAEVVEQFLRAVGMFPTASVVELNNGMVGLVIEQNQNQPLRPKVMLLLDRDHQPLKQPQIIELRDLLPDATHPRAVWIAQGHQHGAFGIDPMDYFKPGIR
jgi:HD-GYP domain-containing protein (c-di-GMP phosphodiesterase class II)